MGKVDHTKQNKAQSYFNGWENTSKRLLSLAILIIVILLGFTILWSVIGPTKFFSKRPSRQEISNAHLEKLIKNYKFPK